MIKYIGKDMFIKVGDKNILLKSGREFYNGYVTIELGTFYENNKDLFVAVEDAVTHKDVKWENSKEIETEISKTKKTKKNKEKLTD